MAHCNPDQAASQPALLSVVSRALTAVALATCVASFVWAAQEDEIVIDPGNGGGADSELVIEPDDESGSLGEPGIVIEPDPGELIIDTTEPGSPAGVPPTDRAGAVSAGVDQVWLEVGILDGAAKPVDTTNYLNGEFSIEWEPRSEWELRAAARVDGYSQTGSPDFQELDLDYGESFARYRGDQWRLTAGAQKIIWGRIDELPPTDRLSVVDLSRLVLDDLADRRRPTLAVRGETFFGTGKLDLVWVPVFRGAVLPERDSIWYPVDRERGRLLGISPKDLPKAVVRGAGIDDDEPSDASGWGARYTQTTSAVDFGLTVQRNRQSLPYYVYRAGTNTFEAKYPRAWSAGGDAAIEAAGITWRAEAAWVSDVPITRKDFGYDTVEAINWGAGAEFHPGDGDTRVNVQVVGLNLVDAPSIFDRKDSYNLNGSVHHPFAQDRWRLNLRLFFGLDEKDVYVNPKLSFLGWEPHEVYLALDYFDGADNTPGGFHEDHSLLRLGWRSLF